MSEHFNSRDGLSKPCPAFLHNVMSVYTSLHTATQQSGRGFGSKYPKE